MKLNEALVELRKEEKRKFPQSVDLIVNLKGIDLKRENVAGVFEVPHKIKDKVVCGFLNERSELVRTVTKLDFPKYKDKKAMKKLVEECDFFIASASLMPLVAATFGKALGPAGKMPSPQLGVLMQENEKTIGELLKKIDKSIKVRAKEPSIKLMVGKEDMTDSQILENVQAAYNGIVNALPNKKESVRNVMIKFTMTKPIKVEM
jgi:large subunit ribosomal protein L1